jgi:predicted Zn-dependent protease
MRIALALLFGFALGATAFHRKSESAPPPAAVCTSGSARTVVKEVRTTAVVKEKVALSGDDRKILAVSNSRARMRDGKVDEARELLEPALAAAPDDADLNAELGALLRFRRDPAAAAYLERALRKNPSHELALRETVEWAAKAKDEERAAADELLSRNARDHWDQPAPQGALADYLYRTNQPVRARDHFEALARRRAESGADEKSVDVAKMDYALGLLATGAPEQAEAVLRPLVAKYPDDGPFQRMYADAKARTLTTRRTGASERASDFPDRSF